MTGPTSEVEKIKNIRFLQKLIKLHEMTGNSPKGKLKQQVSKKLRLRLARGVEINSVANSGKRERECDRSIEVSQSVRD